MPSYIKQHYRRLVLVSSPDEAFDALFDDDTLVVTSDWPMWCAERDKGRHCLHLEAGLADWGVRDTKLSYFVERILESMRHADNDPTVYMGVSLLDTLQSEVIHMGRFFMRLRAELEWFIDRFKPEEIMLVDLEYEKRPVPPSSKSLAVSLIAARHGLMFTDELAASGNRGGVLVPRTRTGLKTWLKSALGDVYTAVVSAACRARIAAAPSKPRVLVQPTGAMIEPLLTAYDGEGVTPVLFARQMPKSPSFVMRCLAKGVLLSSIPDAPVRADAVRIAAEMATGLERHWRDSLCDDPDLAAFIRDLVRATILETGRLQPLVVTARAYETFLERNRIRRIVVSGFLNPQAMTFLQLARAKGIPTDDILHGIRTSYQRFPQMRRESHAPPLISRLLAWGQQNLDWLDGIDADSDAVIAGYPALAVKGGPSPSDDDAHPKKALVLPFEPDRDNIVALHAHAFAALVESIRTLSDMGYVVTVKVHPGLNIAPYARIVHHFGLHCDVVNEGDFAEHAAAADVIVGPIGTSAMILSLGLGKSYYPFSVRPNIDDPKFLLGCPTSGNGAELRRAIDGGHCLENEAILEYFCEVKNIPDPAKRVWQAIREGLPIES